MSGREGRVSASSSTAHRRAHSREKPPSLSDCERLNVLVCGSDGSLKSSISELILQHTHRRSESVRTDVDLHGRLINVLELPALFNTGLSEEEVMRQTLCCVSRCHPGVHAFLLIIPDAPLNNEDRAEMEEIQKIFSSRINKHIMILIMQNSEHQTAELSEETQTVIQRFGGRHHYFNPETQEATLMENIEKMLEENSGGFYSTETFLEVQMEKLMEYEEMKKKLHSLEKQGLAESKDELRIVLLGKTGVGKSSTGNTILEKSSFSADVSQESVTEKCQSETCEINGRRITVIDTPGLFDTELSEEEFQREINNCISMILPGPHVFIIVLSLGQRFTKEEETSVKFIKETFGEHSLMFTIVLFTRGDDLKNKSLDQCLGKPGSVIRKLLETCRNRFHVFNNNQPEDRTQVSELLEKIDNMVKANGGSFFSCKMIREMEREKQEQQMKILIDRVRETEEKMKRLEEENERMKMMMEEEQQQNLEKERKIEKELETEIREEQHQRETRDEMKREQERFRNEIEEMRKEKEKTEIEKENLKTEYEREIDRLMKRIEDEQNKNEEYKEREEQYKTQIKKKDREINREREEMRKEKDEFQVKHQTEIDKLMKRIEDEQRKNKEYIEREEQNITQIKEKDRKMEEEMKREQEKIRKEKEELQVKHQTDIDKLKKIIEDEQKKIKEYTEWEEQYKTQIKKKDREINREREEMRKEKDELQVKHQTEIDKLKKIIEDKKEKYETERKRREEFNEREEQYKREIKTKIENEEKMQEKLKEERNRTEGEKEEKKKMKITIENLKRDKEELTKKLEQRSRQERGEEIAIEIEETKTNISERASLNTGKLKKNKPRRKICCCIC